MDIVIIGSGNVASVIGRKANQAGHRILQVVSRDLSRASEVGRQLGSPAGTLKDIDLSGALYIVALADEALLNIGEWLELNKLMVVHTAGSVNKDVLKQVSRNYGVLWPLQSLRKEIEAIPDFPIAVDANTGETLTLLEDFARSVSPRVVALGDEERRKLHLAATFSANFANHLYALACNYCRKEGIDFSLLLPLLQESVSRIGDNDPSLFQTGPAVRKDLGTVRAHLDLLDGHLEMKKIYELMTDSIINHHP